MAYSWFFWLLSALHWYILILGLCFRNAAVCTSCCVTGKETINEKTCMSMRVLNLQNNKDIFSTIRRKQNNCLSDSFNKMRECFFIA